jgi:hypothetical protein
MRVSLVRAGLREIERDLEDMAKMKRRRHSVLHCWRPVPCLHEVIVDERLTRTLPEAPHRLWSSPINDHPHVVETDPARTRNFRQDHE